MNTIGYMSCGIGVAVLLFGVIVIGIDPFIGIFWILGGLVIALVSFDRFTDSRRGTELIVSSLSQYANFSNEIPEVMRPGSAAQQIQSLREEEANNR